MPRYRVSIETYYGYTEGTFDAETKSKAVYKMFKYCFKKPFKFKEFLEIFRPTAEKVADNALMTYREYGNAYGSPHDLRYIDMMKKEE